MTEHHHDHHTAASSHGALVKDPVCGMNVHPETAAATLRHGDKDYYFCHVGCRDKFQADPGRYLNKPDVALVSLQPMGHHHGSGHAVEGAVHKDPVCGMNVKPETAAATLRHGEKDYYFCAIGCRDKFRADPARYLGGAPAPPVVEQREGIEYTCPMHPEVLQIGPGSCPICGMALEPKEIQLGEEDDTELRDMTRRFWVAAALSIPIFISAMGDLIPGRPLERLASPEAWRWVEFILATPVVLWCGWPFMERGW